MDDIKFISEHKIQSDINNLYKYNIASAIP